MLSKTKGLVAFQTLQMTEPEWGTEVVKQVCIHKGRVVRPRIKWIKRSRSCSSGYAYYNNSITMCVGNDPLDQTGVLLHELSHWLAGPKHHHDKRFWLILKDLLQTFGHYVPEFVKREHGYMKKAQSYL